MCGLATFGNLCVCANVHIFNILYISKQTYVCISIFTNTFCFAAYFRELVNPSEKKVRLCDDARVAL